MNERLLKMTGYLVCQFLMLLLTPLVLLLTSINALLRELLQEVEKASNKPVHIHYELHQHVHLESTATYTQTVDNVSKHMPLPLKVVEHPVQPRMQTSQPLPLPLRAATVVQPVVVTRRDRAA